ncbi:hypothetical protein LCGC14_0894820 [marine sediment metagenome]|uniref:Helix-turn-helix type 11 domain-containing protein n=1 Tax=marine sediment metagenome TaxID=412755 RepID=A0A0F9PIY1_9ZZZZ
MSRMRDKSLVKDRSNYVKKVVAKATSTQKAVSNLAKKLFISERTIYRDLAK